MKNVNGVIFLRSRLKGYWYSPIQLSEYSDKATVQYFVRKHATLKTQYTLSCLRSDEGVEWVLKHDKTVSYLLQEAAKAIISIREYRKAN